MNNETFFLSVPSLMSDKLVLAEPVCCGQWVSQQGKEVLWLLVLVTGGQVEGDM